MYLWRYICIFVEPFHCGGTIWRAVCAQECSANCKPVADIVFMHLLPLLRLVQKRPNWGIKHNKSQNSRANFSGTEMWHCADVCLHSWRKARFGMEARLPGTEWDTCKLFPGIISSPPPLSQRNHHNMSLNYSSILFSQPYTLCSIIVIELSKCCFKYLSVNK